LRQKTADAFEVGDPVLTVLIFGGKILKDHESITTHGIKDGQTIHLVIRNKSENLDSSNQSCTDPLSRRPGANTSSTSQSNNNNNNSGNLNNNNIFSSNNNVTQEIPSMNPLLNNLTDVQQRLQQMLISNPETMQNMMQNMMQQMMSNPNSIRSFFGSMQRMHSLMERNPEVNHLLSNPEVLRESLEMVRNPAALQEVMRNYDRALNNMESMPGGYNVLRRMYTEFQEPLLSAFQENTNQFASQLNQSENANISSTVSDDTDRQGTENRDPLPNPWATPTQAAQNNQGSTRAQQPMGLFGGSGAGTGTPSPEMAQQIRNQLEAHLGNAGLGSELGSLLGGIGGQNLYGISNTQDLLQRASALFQDQEFMSLLTHPEALQSVLQIQQGIERLQRIAPNLFDRLGYPTLARPNSGTSSNDNRAGNNGNGGTDSSDKPDNDKDKSKKSDGGHDKEQ